eukprot:Nk52_evm1s2526 gene=Nk52_evmTU1s2526
MSQYSVEYDNNQFEVIGEELDASQTGQMSAGNDPTEDFLAQERADLEDLGHMNGFQDQGDDGNGDDALHNSGENHYFGNEEQNMEDFHFHEDSTNNNNNNNNSNNNNDSSPIDAAPVQQEESEELRQMKLKQEQAIAEKDAKAAVEYEALLEKAKQDLMGFYERYETQKSKSQSANRENQEVLNPSSGSGSDSWEKVCEMVDFNPKNSKNVKDTTRMKSIFLQLKQAPLKT